MHPLSSGLRHVLLYMGLPFIFLLDFFFFTIARPSCPACATFSGFLSDSSLTAAYIQQLPDQMRRARTWYDKIKVAFR